MFGLIYYTHNRCLLQSKKKTYNFKIELEHSWKFVQCHSNAQLSSTMYTRNDGTRYHSICTYTVFLICVTIYLFFFTFSYKQNIQWRRSLGWYSWAHFWIFVFVCFDWLNLLCIQLLRNIFILFGQFWTFSLLIYWIVVDCPLPKPFFD